MNIKLLLHCLIIYSCIQICKAQTWTSINPHTSYNVTSVDFINDSVGYIGGGIWSGPLGVNSTFLKKTVNRGQTFTVLFDSSNYTPIHQMYFYTEQYGLIKRWQDVINVTYDGGQTDTSLLPSGCSAAASKFQVLDNKKIYLYQPNCNNNGIAMSTDNGQNWTFNNGLASSGVTIIGNFLNADTGIIFNGTTVLRTWDKGLNWQPIYNAPVNQIICIDSEHVVMINNYQVLQSLDFGNTWNTTYNGLHPYSVMEYKDNLLLVASDNGIFLKSYDWGSNWILDSPPTLEPINGISIVDAFHEIFYIVGNNGTMYRHENLTAGIKENFLQSEDLSLIYYSNSNLSIRNFDQFESHLTIFDITGKKIIDQALNGSEDFSLLSFMRGVYIYSLMNGAKIMRGKFVVE